MRPNIEYDFTDFLSIIANIKDSSTQQNLINLKDELNDFFKESRCNQILYTENIDKLFFGIRVLPRITGNDAVTILTTNDSFIIRDYEVEIDSKLFDPVLNLENSEILAILLHEVGYMVKDDIPVDTVRKNIDVYLAKSQDYIRISDSVHYRELLAYGIKDALYKVTSVFAYCSDELEADEFLIAIGLEEDFELAYQKLIASGIYINDDLSNKMIVLAWVLRLYKDVKLRRISALRTIKKGKDLTGSKLEFRELDNVARRLVRIDDDALLESSKEQIKNKNSIFNKLKYSGLKTLEDDYYEYVMRYRNIEDENEAIMLLRQINSRISIIDNYCTTEKLSESDRKRWYNTLEKFRKLRNDLSKKMVYRDNLYGAIIVNYPDIKDNR